MTTWMSCSAVERDPEKVSGVWVFERGTASLLGLRHYQGKVLRDDATID